MYVLNMFCMSPFSPVLADHIGTLFGDHDDGEFVLPLVMVGMTEASTTRSPLEASDAKALVNDR